MDSWCALGWGGVARGGQDLLWDLPPGALPVLGHLCLLSELSRRPESCIFIDSSANGKVTQ